MRKKTLLAIGFVLLALLVVAVLNHMEDSPSNPPPPEEPPPPVPEVEPEVELPPAPVATKLAPKPEPPSATLVLTAIGGELPRRIALLQDGEPRGLTFPPWADPKTRRILLPGASVGSTVEASAEGFAKGKGVVEEPALEARVELGAFASIVVTTGVRATQPMKLFVRSGEKETEEELGCPGQVVVAGLHAGCWQVEVHGGSRLPLFRKEVQLDWGERANVPIRAADLGLLVTGRTVTENGDPVVGAAVKLRAHGLPEGYLFAETEVTSDRRGRFRVFLPPKVAFELSAEKAGYGRVGPLKLELGEEAPEPLVLELFRGQGVRGIVVNESGAPVAGALVQCSHPPDPGQDGRYPSAKVTTGEDGTFRFDEFAHGRIATITARKEGFAVGFSPPLEIGPETRDVRIVVRPEVPLEVHVVEEDTAKPLDVFVLSAFASHRDQEDWRAGVALFTEKIGLGRFLVRGFDGTVALSLQPSSLTDHITDRRRFEDPGKGPVIIECPRWGGVAIDGRVLDEQGRPVEGVMVVVRVVLKGERLGEGADGERRLAMDRTDAKGRFRLAGLAPGEKYRIVAKHERGISGVILASSGPVWVTMEEDCKLEIRIYRAGSVVGRVSPENAGVPITGLTTSVDAVTYDSGETAEPGQGMGSSLSPSHVRLKGLRPGRYDLVVGSWSHLPLILRGVVVRAGEKTDLGELVLREGSVCQVTVRTPDGDPVPKFCLRVVGPDNRHVSFTQTDDHGRATVRRLPSAPLVLVGYGLDIPHFVVAELHPEPHSRQKIEVTTPVAGALRLEVTDRRGRPCGGAAVEIRADAPTPLDHILVSGFTRVGYWPGRLYRRLWNEPDYRTNSDGTLDLGPLTPGRYLVKIGSVEGSITIAPGETAELAMEVSR